MATLIPTYSLSDFKRLKADQIRRLKSCEITSDGEYLCTIIMPTTDYIKLQCENAGQLSNSLRGETLEQVMKQEVTV